MSYRVNTWMAGDIALRHQPCSEPDLHADSLRDAELAAGSGGHPDRFGPHPLDGGHRAAALPLGGHGSVAIVRVGVAGNGATIKHHLDELGEAMIRLGLCCMFRDESIKFVTTAATSISQIKRPDALAKLSRLCRENADALHAAFQFGSDNGAGCCRVNSQILPIKTHPTCGYSVGNLTDGDEIIRRFKECEEYVKKHKLQTCFHLDQFVVLNSQGPVVVEKSVQELAFWHYRNSSSLWRYRMAEGSVPTHPQR